MFERLQLHSGCIWRWKVHNVEVAFEIREHKCDSMDVFVQAISAENGTTFVDDFLFHRLVKTFQRRILIFFGFDFP